MKTRRQTNLLWGVVLLAATIVLVLRALGQIPDGIYDLISRAWPALLVLAGLAILLRGRVPLGSGVAFVLTALLVGGMAAYSLSTRAEQQRRHRPQAHEAQQAAQGPLRHAEVGGDLLDRLGEHGLVEVLEQDGQGHRAHQAQVLLRDRRRHAPEGHGRDPPGVPRGGVRARRGLHNGA